MGIFRNKQRQELPRNRQSPNESWMTPYSQYNTRSYNMKAVIKQVQRVPDVNFALNRIADKITQTEFILNKVLNKRGDLKSIGSTKTSNGTGTMEFIMKPNFQQDFFTMIRLAAKYKRSTGQYLFFLDRGKDPTLYTGRVKQVSVMNPDWIYDRPRDGNPYYTIGYNKERSISIHMNNIIEYGNPDMENPYQTFWGDGQSLSDEIAIVEKSSVQTASYFENNMMPQSIVSAKGMPEPKAGRPSRLEESWKSKFLGFAKRNIPFFTGADITVTRLQSEFKDVELKDLRKEEKEYIRRMFDDIINLDSANRSTAQVVVEKFYNDQVLPMLDEICRIYNLYILPQVSKESLLLTYTDPTPADKELQSNILNRHLNFSTKKRLADWGGFALEEWEDPSEIMIPATMVRVSLEKETITDAQGKMFKIKHNELKTLRKKANYTTKQNEGELILQLNAIIDEQFSDDELYNDVVDEYVDLMQTEGNKELAALTELTDEVIPSVFNIANPEAVAYLQENVAENVSYISNTYRNFLKKRVSDGVNDGLGTTQIVNNIMADTANSYEDYLNENSLTRIVRTEVHDSFQATKLESYNQGNVPYKQWITALDELVRDYHTVLEGVIVGVKEVFTSGLGNTAMYPGGFDTAEENAACRCSIIPKYNQQKQVNYTEIKNAELQQMEDTLALYEPNFATAYETGLKTQLNKIINKMEEM